MEIQHYLEHTWLKADTTPDKIRQICQEALDYDFKGVCIPPYYVKEAKALLKDSNVKVVTVVGFPMGYSTTAAKVEEIKRAINDKVDELDVVINVAAIKSGNWDFVESDVERMTIVAHMADKPLKLIAEVGFLTDEELKKACNVATMFSVDYFKTSSGYTGVDTTPEMIAKIRGLLAEDVKIKASGGIRDYATARAVIDAGADRIGSSSCIKIIEEAKATM